MAWRLGASSAAIDEGGDDRVLPIGVSAPPRSHRPWVTGVLAVLCLAVYVRVQLLRDARLAPYCSDLTESPQALRRAAGTVQLFVCQYGAIPDELAKGRELQTLFTALFVHATWFHLLANLLFLVAFAPRVEEDLGSGGLLALFLGGGVLAGLAHVLVGPNLVSPAIGASGAVAAVMGAHLLLAKGAQVLVLIGPVPMRLPSRFVIALWAVLQAAYAAWALSRAEYPGGTSYEVHAAGFLVGLAVVGGWLRLRRSADLTWQPDVGRRRDG
jgi:membrane associated rhomboid family serine protease